MIRNYLPKKIQSVIFGNREKFGTKIIENDTCWIEWLKFTEKFYLETQKRGIGKIINEMGYKILKNVDFNNKVLLELGPGNLPHKKFWLNEPNKFYAIDTNKNFLKSTKEKINCEFEGIKVSRSSKIPIESNSVNIILSFYSLEHIYELDQMLKEFNRILKKDGIIVGAIPNEGGLAWGIGRYLTTRRYTKKFNINYDKIICWEHPNFADFILNSFEKNKFRIEKIKFSPFNYIKCLDFNLVTSFILKKNY
jgi:ubiquinone/menaquinone biosynthesis C-methylase UbiE